MLGEDGDAILLAQHTDGGLEIQLHTERIRHACGLTRDGGAWCWGYNTSGQLGDGTTTWRMQPTAVTGGLTFTALSAGADHSCGLTQDGSAYCWGQANSGQLGTDERLRQNQKAPVKVSGSERFDRIIAGPQRTCALTRGGEAYCWGSNGWGSLGDGTDTLRTAPTRVVGRLTFDELVLGNIHSCGRTRAGEVYCWGGNTFGQLGDGTKEPKSTPVRVGEGLVFRSITAGGFQTCGVTQGGEAYCWGKDPTRPLGDANASVPKPTRVGTLSFGVPATQ